MTTVTRFAQPRPAEPSLQRYTRFYVWQLPIRISHWVNALAVTVLFLTGLYIAGPLLTSTGEPWETFTMARVRQIHFAAAFIFIVFFLWRSLWLIIGNTYARSGFPYVWRASWWKDLFGQAWDYLRLDLGRPHAGHNSLAGFFYAIFVGLCLLQMLTGLALYSESDPGGFWSTTVGWVIPLLGGSMRTHMWHHMFAWCFLWFVIVHVYIVLLDTRQYRNGLIGSMIHGYKFRRLRPQER